MRSISRTTRGMPRITSDGGKMLDICHESPRGTVPEFLIPNAPRSELSSPKKGASVHLESATRIQDAVGAELGPPGLRPKLTWTHYLLTKEQLQRDLEREPRPLKQDHAWSEKDDPNY